MATIHKKGKTFYVIYYYINEKGEKKQKWEPKTSMAEAKKFKNEIELAQLNKTLIAPSEKSVSAFLLEWIDVYGKANWQYGTYTTNVALINNHILPYIGEIPIQKLTPLDIEKLYMLLREKKVGGSKSHRDLSDIPCLSSTTIRLIHVLLKRAFSSAVEWKMLTTNPVSCKAPKKNEVDTKIWDAETVAKALLSIKHERLHLAVHLAFICSLRIGEAMGLTWDCVDFDRGCITINKTCQRVSKKALAELPKDTLVCTFPSMDQSKNSVIILKKPKTRSSTRTVYLTKPLMQELVRHKQLVAKQKCFHNQDYQDYSLVFCSECGLPIEPKLCEKWFKKWLSSTEGEFPGIIFHEIRHSSTTYKLIVSEGDYKSVQADNGHSSADMTLDTYGHIQNQARLRLMHRLEEDFYTHMGIAQTSLHQEKLETKKISAEEALKMVLENPQLLEKCLQAHNAQDS